MRDVIFIAVNVLCFAVLCSYVSGFDRLWSERCTWAWSMSLPRWRRLVGRTPVYKLVTEAAGLDLHIVSLENRERKE
jgi:hypothetical protein